MEEIKRGQIYWIDKTMPRLVDGCPAPHKSRPAIIVSNDKNNEVSNYVEIVYLTTQEKRPIPTHCTIRSALAISTALCESVHTVHIDDIGDYIGQCTDAEMMNVDACLSISLGLVNFAPGGCVATPIEEEEEPQPDFCLLTPVAMEEFSRMQEELIASRAREAMLRELYNELRDVILRNK